MTIPTIGTAALLVAAALLPASQALAQSAGLVTRMSVSSTGVEGDLSASRSAVSADGRFIAFDSAATNLVPGDTNDNSDVFVHDTHTGVVQRVSVAWNGMESRDDSRCPAISADGRWVAFLSRGWNMFPGGANLGHDRYDVYVHDRQTGTTIPISRAPDGAEPNGESECPTISADGRRVAFASRARNLVRLDGNLESDVFLYDLDKQKMKLISKTAENRSGNGHSTVAAISADGNSVAFVSSARNLDGAVLSGPGAGINWRAFVRDLATGTTEIVDVTPFLPSEHPDGSSFDVAISADGRKVAFTSWARNLVSPPPPFGRGINVYVRDRDAARTTLVSYQDPLYDDCSHGPGAVVCGANESFAPALSGDGRYVSFASYSQRLLPMSFTWAPQVYLYDTLGGRLRRLTVGPTGEEAACSGDPAISHDGSVVTLSSDAGIVPQRSAPRDIYRHEWRRIADGRERAAVACPPKPTTCAPAISAVFRLRKRPPGGVHDDRLFWRWHGRGEEQPLPDPTDDARYQLCVYGGPQGVVAMDVGTPEAGACPAGDAPCWQIRNGLHQLRDAQGGLAALTVNGATNATRISARGSGPMLDAPYLPLTGTQGLTVQLQETTTGRCWGADFPAAAIRKNFPGTPGSGSRQDGWLVARLP